jgi:hypothetical protein
MEQSSELAMYEALICDSYMPGIAHRMRTMKPQHWDWAPYPSAPTARTSAVHAWQWLMCDRQHILHGDMIGHVTEPPPDPEAFADAVLAESEAWRSLLRSLDPAELARPLRQFGNPEEELDLRWFLAHSTQNLIYKAGQVSWVYFALGYDGVEPYAAPFPNPIFDELAAQRG